MTFQYVPEYSYTGECESYTWGLTGSGLFDAMSTAVRTNIEFLAVVEVGMGFTRSDVTGWTGADAFEWGISIPFSAGASRVLAENVPANELWSSSHEGEEPF